MSQTYYLHTSKHFSVKAGINTPATIAIKREGDLFTYGIALCSRHDNFSRKYGREVAESRMERGFATIQVPGVIKDRDEKASCIEQLRNLQETILVRPKKWKKRITAFNLDQRLKGTSIEAETITNK